MLAFVSSMMYFLSDDSLIFRARHRARIQNPIEKQYLQEEQDEAKQRAI